MNVLRLILQNLRKGTVSFRLPHRHECTSNEYRGLIQNDAARCVGCGACAYVCPTGAIEVKRGPESYSWTYDPGKCTFCARCIDRCRPNTLSIESKLPPLYSHQGELTVAYEMQKKKPAPRPAPAAAAAASAPAVAPSAPATKEPPAALGAPEPAANPA
jgi:formate hydrogenlyase subunit 6/NADH:ubiquinone oxidoreductase subunit I